jgi:hypothetical protein
LELFEDGLAIALGDALIASGAADAPGAGDALDFLCFFLLDGLAIALGDAMAAGALIADEVFAAAGELFAVAVFALAPDFDLWLPAASAADSHS